MQAKFFNTISLSVICGLLGALLYSQAFSKSIIYIDLDAVINRTKDHIIEVYGQDSEIIQQVSAVLGERIQDILKDLESDHVVIAENAILAGGKDYTEYMEKKIKKTINGLKN